MEKDSFLSVFGPTVNFEGLIRVTGDLAIEGKNKGNIESSACIQIGEKAVIEGNIAAKKVIIAGKVTGNVKIETVLEVREKAIICGNFEADQLIVAPGAILRGECKIGPSPK